MTDTTLTDAIKEKYGKAATGARTSSCCGGHPVDPIPSNFYDAHQTDPLPVEAVTAPLGGGNPPARGTVAAGQGSPGTWPSGDAAHRSGLVASCVTPKDYP